MSEKSNVSLPVTFMMDEHRVAEDAVRLVKRMSMDWMVMGRRPSGVLLPPISRAQRLGFCRGVLLQHLSLVCKFFTFSIV